METIHSFTPVWIILTSSVAALLVALLGRWPNVRETCIFAAAAIKLGLLLSLAPAVLDGKLYEFEVMELLPNVGLAFKVDALGLLFALVSVSLWIPTTIFSMGLLRPLKQHAQTRFFFFFAIAISSAVGVAFSANLLTLFIFYEALSLSTYPLVTHNQDDDAIKGGRKYLTYLLGTSIALALPAMIIVYQQTGNLDFTNGGVFASGTSTTLLVVLLVMFLFGFAKAGLMPFHAWLPGAMVAPAPVSALLHAVAVVKVGVFSIIRVLTGIFGVDLLANTPSLSTIVCVLAAHHADRRVAHRAHAGQHQRAAWPTRPSASCRTSSWASAWPRKAVSPGPRYTSPCTPLARSPCSFAPGRFIRRVAPSTSAKSTASGANSH